MVIIDRYCNDYKRLADIHNAASVPFAKIFSDEEKEQISLLESAASIQEAFDTRDILVAKVNEVIAGYSFFRFKNQQCCWISSLYVHPDFQKSGVGTHLLSAIEAHACDYNRQIVALETHARAVWANRFYEKNGYNRIEAMISDAPYSSVLSKDPVQTRYLYGKLV